MNNRQLISVNNCLIQVERYPCFWLSRSYDQMFHIDLSAVHTSWTASFLFRFHTKNLTRICIVSMSILVNIMIGRLWCSTRQPIWVSPILFNRPIEKCQPDRTGIQPNRPVAGTGYNADIDESDGRVQLVPKKKELILNELSTEFLFPKEKRIILHELSTEF